MQFEASSSKNLDPVSINKLDVVLHPQEGLSERVMV
jgi:hypothetical protein